MKTKKQWKNWKLKWKKPANRRKAIKRLAMWRKEIQILKHLRGQDQKNKKTKKQKAILQKKQNLKIQHIDHNSTNKNYLDHKSRKLKLQNHSNYLKRCYQIYQTLKNEQ
nr:hypothetical protein [Mycoplasmopsis bovis]